MPIDKLPVATVRAILAGGAEVCAEAGIPVAGGHSIDAPEPIYGLVAIGLCRPEEVRRNGGARPGDALILTKAIGVGVYSAAIKQGVLSAAGYEEFIGSTTLLNRVGGSLGGRAEVHAVTDVTGFGLLGHALEMARGGGLAVVIEDGRRAAPRPGRGAGARRAGDRGVGAELGELRLERGAAGGDARLAAAAPDRPADLRRAAHRLCAGGGGRASRRDRRGGLPAGAAASGGSRPARRKFA